MTQAIQDSLNLDIRPEASLEDFQSSSYRLILDAIDKLVQGSLRELFIVGDSGFGKTHLASAIYGHYTSMTSKMVISLNLTELIEQDPHATALVGLEMFDLIIVDDLQMVRHSYEWQEGLFHLINRLREHQKQILYLADDPARELQIGLLDLHTRLSLAPMLTLPDNDDINDRRILLEIILKKKNWKLPEEIFDYLLEEGPRNAGDINTVLDHIRPLLTRLSRVQIPKKTITEAKQIILHETFVLEIGDNADSNF
ncbi:chromosomal replication initiator DnaA [Moraxella catarrhalis]|uniref:DnaA ATPase domain-containing protein n=1 Tax=Moraxella catarrhalis TaxID=480 RepID=UPI0007E4D1CD|nr:DnaA/Hda family protein [Moraxella catarrhalis]MPW64552.1 chromosomal replication initiator DnaA [Moraxella catarrhalis]MPW74263.1 chromosomal replication initiator DnaA [Moraxella catarrhalis]OAV02265.1 Chromosomal replication initiator protein DnaA [Moraxella catarrhalis]OAV13913.1 Chromosomal replication initiator protein DnaA [Moraxella catarrhalis]OAV16775.1 Chromosomal replication initiator protein DnaA [Moraxella catarrhalis]